ncbi:hypothetical protein CCU68_29380 [Pseudomonas gingeri NCPPB 3146 = LMG 5327]|uniref:Prophage PSSB64-01 n=2 Tax=Pseudomonas gingeri TaxID=117681 RepID=A0A7Y8CEE8_9PSED|nr:hypothetical protein [Pseudomonas gingeri]NWC16180.1 hypothetical protein [Pseudomonas gingeri]PNQ89021.1 hypothetical protein CCU68_29380 [Pseudomonas gingeri NCPPB 3146 = LMG 5327]
MQAQHQSSSGTQAITPARHLVVTAIIGAAVIGYLVHKTPESRAHLENLSQMASTLGELSDRDAAVVARLLTQPPTHPSSALPEDDHHA